MLRRVDDHISLRTLGYVPVTVLILVAVSLYFEVNGIRHEDLYPTLSRALLFDPVYHLVNAFLHFDRAHFTWNMRLLIPFGVLLTWLTSNRHVLVVVVFVCTVGVE
jgi:membrane associated rhomboid family serine protease